MDVAALFDDLSAKADEGLRGQFTLIRRPCGLWLLLSALTTVLATIGVNITGLVALGGVLVNAFPRLAGFSPLVGTINI